MRKARKNNECIMDFEGLGCMQVAAPAACTGSLGGCRGGASRPHALVHERRQDGSLCMFPIVSGLLPGRLLPQHEGRIPSEATPGDSLPSEALST